MKKVLIGPILKDLEGAGLSGKETVIATAYYTAGPLSQLRIDSEKVTLVVRLDFDNLADWVSGGIDPVALLKMSEYLVDKGSDLRLYVGKHAHAKMYIGERSALIGSANLTSRGFSGVGDEVMWSVDFRGNERNVLSAGVKRYVAGMQSLSLEDLKSFVEKNQALVNKKKKNNKVKNGIYHTKILDSQRPIRLGNYQDFLKWLQQQKTVAANEVLERANGKNNLSGHIYRNYYGIRQYLIYSPKKLEVFRRFSEDTYKLTMDMHTENDINIFVNNFATDEADFVLDAWKTYLPQECGGRAAKHGGTIGNMNRMLPLVAKYLSLSLSKVK